MQISYIVQIVHYTMYSIYNYYMLHIKEELQFYSEILKKNSIHLFFFLLSSDNSHWGCIILRIISFFFFALFFLSAGAELRFETRTCPRAGRRTNSLATLHLYNVAAAHSI